ncbi:MAG: AAA family ATPase [Pseudomonadota bacterium]
MSVVLIDEIDLHLHWQRQIIKSLRTTFPLIQFIATTHSPSIVQSLQPGELINLNDYDMGEYYQVLENAKSAPPEQIAALERRLVVPFSDEVAYHTFLEMERTAAGLGSKHETR